MNKKGGILLTVVFLLSLLGVMNVFAYPAGWQHYCNESGVSDFNCNLTAYGGDALIEAYLSEYDYVDYNTLNQTAEQIASDLFDKEIENELEQFKNSTNMTWIQDYLQNNGYYNDTEITNSSIAISCKCNDTYCLRSEVLTSGQVDTKLNDFVKKTDGDSKYASKAEIESIVDSRIDKSLNATDKTVQELVDEKTKLATAAIWVAGFAILLALIALGILAKLYMEEE